MNRSIEPLVISDKWRPSLGFVIGGVLTVVLTLPMLGMAVVVLVTRPPEMLLASLRNNISLVVVASLVVMIATAVVGFLFWRLFSRPVQDLLEWTEQVASGRTVRPVDATSFGTVELAGLAASFSEMVRRLNKRSDYIATYTAHVSHELKSPLTAIAGAAEVMREAGGEMDLATQDRFLSNIERDALRLSALVTKMRELARVEIARSAGSSFLDDILPELRKRFPAMQIIQEGAPPALPISADDALLVFSHIADNAAAHGARTVTVKIVGGPDDTIVTVRNDGEPISAGNRTRIFEPFFTTRREAGGTGMGLAIIRTLLATHRGTIDLVDWQPPTSRAESEVCFRISIPNHHP